MPESHVPQYRDEGRQPSTEWQAVPQVGSIEGR
jgi:hypothetical protein